MGQTSRQSEHPQNWYERSLHEYDKALECDPFYAPAFWMRLLSLPLVYDHPDQIEQLRHQFGRNLDLLIRTIPLDTDHQRAFALKGVQSTTNFYLHYQGRDDLEYQAKYGRFAHAVMVANFPDWSINKTMPPIGPHHKVRIGYVSSFMYHHTVGVFLSGWLMGHTTETFDIHCYHVGNKVDSITRLIQEMAIQMARQPHRLRKLKTRIGANKHRLYEDRQFMSALESFYHSVVQSKRTDTSMLTAAQIMSNS